jgi:hypothetical protein
LLANLHFDFKSAKQYTPTSPGRGRNDFHLERPESETGLPVSRLVLTAAAPEDRFPLPIR